MTTTDVILRNLFFHCPAAVFSKDSEQLFLYLPRGFSEFICLIMIRAWILIRAISKLWGFRAQTRDFRNVMCFEEHRLDSISLEQNHKFINIIVIGYPQMLSNIWIEYDLQI